MDWTNKAAKAGFLACVLLWHSLAWPNEVTDTPGVIYTVEERAGRFWSGVKAFFTALTQIFLPPSPTDVARRIHAGETLFWTLLVDAGYELDDVQVTASLIPKVSASFRLARELSDADREWLQRRMDELARTGGGLMEGLQRSVILMLLEASENGGYKIDRVHLVLSPLPEAQLSLKPLPPSQDTPQVDLSKSLSLLRYHRY